MRDGSRERFFWKFGPAEPGKEASQHFGPAYEALVYGRVFPSRRQCMPRLRATFLNEARNQAGLALEYLEGAVPLFYLAAPQPWLEEAARWIARFHAASETAAVPSFLRRYDGEHYGRCAARAERLASPRGGRFQALAGLCRECERRLPAVLPAEVVIHGDYRANNILLSAERVVPVDWESAAWAAGAIDLATLTWGWDERTAASCTREYRRVRWSDGGPADFAVQLAAARLFLELRSFGDQADKARADETSPDWNALFAAAEDFQRQTDRGG